MYLNTPNKVDESVLVVFFSYISLYSIIDFDNCIFNELLVLETKYKLSSKSLYLNSKMVGLPGLEPGTSPLSGVHSNQLSYRPYYCASNSNEL